MKKGLFCCWAFCLFFLSATYLNAQNTTENTDVEVSESVLKTAEWARFEYKEVLAQAKGGNIVAIKKLLDFHGTVDGVDALKHAVTCLELIPVAGDENFAAAVSTCHLKLKRLLLERITLAQGRTKKESLRKSMADWAPVSWAYLNGKVAEQSGATKPAETTDAGQPAAADGVKPASLDASKTPAPAMAKPGEATLKTVAPSDTTSNKKQ